MLHIFLCSTVLFPAPRHSVFVVSKYKFYYFREMGFVDADAGNDLFRRATRPTPAHDAEIYSFVSVLAVEHRETSGFREIFMIF